MLGVKIKNQNRSNSEWFEASSEELENYSAYVDDKENKS